MESSYRETRKKCMTRWVRICIVAELQSLEVRIRTALLQETRLVHAVDDMATVGLLVAVSRSSCVAHTSEVLTALCWLQDFDLQRSEHLPPPQGLYFLAVPWCLVDAQNSRVRIGGGGFLQMSFGLAVYAWGIVPDTSDTSPNHTCNACSRVLRLCTLSLHSRLQTTL
jgi:hypothetical protein